MIILTEKPGVAVEFAKVLGCQKAEGYFFKDDLCIVFAYGHLLELFEPHDYDPRLKKWSLESLPILPEKMQYKAKEKTKEQLHIVKKCFEKYGDSLLLATDAEREGELIGATILEYVGFKNYEGAKRFWVSEALTPEVIKKGIANAKPLSEYAQYKNEGLARQQADWMVGLNITRFLTVKANTLLTFGRVQTAVLNAIYKREAEIKNFQKEIFYQLEGIFDKEGKQFKALYTKDENNRLSENQRLQDIAQNIGATAFVENKEIEKKSLLPPLLYNLTGLQKDASQYFDFSPEKTLNLAQSLYEKHKCLSYPRTPSRVMGDDNQQLFRSIYLSLRAHYTEHAEESLLENLDRYTTRIFDSSSLVDHHALIPLKLLPDDASNDEAKVYELVLQRFFEQFMLPHVFNTETITLNANNHVFIAKGKQIIQEGWKRKKEDTEEKEQTLPPLEKGNNVDIIKTEVLEKWTEPKKYYTETSILSLMENPKNKEGRKIIGIGTPATRAAILSNLFEKELIARNKKNLITTEKGKHLINTCYQDKNIAEFIEVETTTNWEERLSENQARFMDSIKSFVKSIIENNTITIKKWEDTSLGLCPVCNSPMRKGEKNYYCSGYKEGCKFNVWKTYCGAAVTNTDIVALLNGKTTNIKKMKSKAGADFQARLTLEDKKVVFVFDKK